MKLKRGTNAVTHHKKWTDVHRSSEKELQQQLKEINDVLLVEEWVNEGTKDLHSQDGASEAPTEGSESQASKRNEAQEPNIVEMGWHPGADAGLRIGG
jgi:hypothetical protein